MSAQRASRRVVAAGSTAVVLALALGACGSRSGGSGASPTPTGPVASSQVGLPAPIIVEPGEATVEATVGETIVFNQDDPANTHVSADKPEVLEITQGSDDGSAQFNPAAKALAPGVAVVTIVAADGTTSSLTVTVR